MRAGVTFEVQDDAMNLAGGAGGQCHGQDPNQCLVLKLLAWVARHYATSAPDFDVD